jgi:diguanylate cyclase (GGDEF)-like protein/PAS domain S-box-containing protein
VASEQASGPVPVHESRLDAVSVAELFDASPDGLVIVDADGNVLAANESMVTLLGHPVADLVGRSVDDLLPAAVRSRHRSHRHAFAMAPRRRGMGTGIDLRALHADGTLIAVDVMLSPLPSAGAGCVLAALRDVSARQEREEEWVHRALHDPLTGLANRTLTLDRLEHALDRSARTGSDVGVLFLDLDRFKPVNDRYGHAAGDTVLVRVAERLQAGTRRSDTVGRVGGDEFVVVVEDADALGSLQAYAERLRQDVAAPVELPDGTAHFGCSIGLATGNGDSVASELLAEADRAMYADKARRVRQPVPSPRPSSTHE